MTLSKAIDKTGKGQASSAPAGSGTPGVVASDETPRGSANSRTAASTAPRLAPVPPVGAGNAAPGSYTPLVVPNAADADDVHIASAKPAAEPPLKVRSNTQPSLASSKAPAAMSASGKAPMSAAAMANPAAKRTDQTTARTAAKPAGMPLAAALVTANAKPYQDPDLIEPANPRQLTANRAAKSLYEKGFVLFGNRQYEQSILVYQNFLSRYPDDIYSDNAQFWIGEAYLRMDKLNEAEAAYRKVLREYAHKSTLEGYKTPDAIYRIGQIFAKRANDKLAKYYLQNVAQRFPDSSAGRKAQRELDGTGPMTSQAEQGEFTTGG
jgi:tol-pal system protein YbgF